MDQTANVQGEVQEPTCCEKMAKLKDWIPVVSPCMAYFLLACNVLFSGSGTCIMACINKEYWKENLIIGILQFVLMFIVIGWVWSVLWGVFVVLRRDLGENDAGTQEPQAVSNPQVGIDGRV